MKIIKNIFLGLLIFVVINVLMLIASLLTSPAGSTVEGSESTRLISLNSLIIALPVGIFTCVLAMLARVASRKEAWQRAAIWTGCQILFFFLIGLANTTLPYIFGALGFYVLLLMTFLGPIGYVWIKRRGD